MPDSKPHRVNPVQLAALLSQYFNLDELESLSFELHFEFEELGEGGRSVKSIRLVKYFERNDRLTDLANALLQQRPTLTWEDLNREAATEDSQALDEATIKALSSSEEAIDEYIRLLDYDPAKLLRVQTEGSTESPPSTERVVSGNSVVICSRIERSLKKNLDAVTIFRPAGGVIFPGALLLADQNLMKGRPTPVALDRGPMTMTVDLPGLLEKPTPVFDPTRSSVQSYLNGILEVWNEKAALQGHVNAARSTLGVTTAYSSRQIALDLDFDAEWAGGDVSAILGLSSNTEKSVAIALIRQIYYSVTMDTPPAPAAVFAHNVSLDQVRATIHDGAVPAYVRSVDYGRILMVSMQTTAVDTKTKLETALKQAISGGLDAGKGEKSDYEDIVRNATFSVIAIGGAAATAMEFSGSEDGVDSLRQYVARDAAYRPDNPGAPISYTLAFLKDNMLAEMGFTTDYVESECVRYPNGFVRLRHDGAYVARFTVSWEEADENGDYAQQSWSSGKQSAGYTHQLDLPGDARNIKIFGEAATGLAWNPWGEALNITEDAPTNKTYRIFGTTLQRKHEIGD